MKKLSLLFVGLLLGMATIAQPVVDNAIIPVAVNLNSILRLNVTSGGNIEWTVNTIDQYQNGIATGPRYQTDFTVASSVDFDINLYAEDATLLGTDDVNNTMSLDNIGYDVVSTGGGADGTNWNLPGTVAALTNAAVPVVTSIGGFGAGDITQNAFQIQWEMGTSGTGMNGSSLLQQSIAPDRYTTNVFLVLVPQ
ncbi:hypothetical protein L21SP5_00618 [Salinivirga cyanobacteriivorans]|uniref:WxL domain-containing protein n=1 Tax=Salinivirga cyanobacteriivorans TaxID=1307839 RepID=A0A0S2HW77_9BACT|nr:hypothetical protein [Salinivirga cyanobacteriivorans]ALO14290.1 hypothetical protein L21SP5_00618 [Salinivirga cyanobacteriivorans]